MCRQLPRVLGLALEGLHPVPARSKEWTRLSHQQSEPEYICALDITNLGAGMDTEKKDSLRIDLILYSDFYRALLRTKRSEYGSGCCTGAPNG